MPTDELGERLLEINRLMTIFPGTGGVAPYTDQTLKTTFYNMITGTWQINYATTVNRLTDPTYEFEELVEYMSNQETAANL